MKISQSARRQIEEVIQQLDTVCRQLDDVKVEVEQSIKGLNTWKYTNGLTESRKKYEQARRKLEQLKY